MQFYFNLIELFLEYNYANLILFYLASQDILLFLQLFRCFFVFLQQTPLFDWLCQDLDFVDGLHLHISFIFNFIPQIYLEKLGEHFLDPIGYLITEFFSQTSGDFFSKFIWYFIIILKLTIVLPIKVLILQKDKLLHMIFHNFNIFLNLIRTNRKDFLLFQKS